MAQRFSSEKGGVTSNVFIVNSGKLRWSNLEIRCHRYLLWWLDEECCCGKVKCIWFGAKELFTWTSSFEIYKGTCLFLEDESVQGVESKENKYNTYEKKRRCNTRDKENFCDDPFGLNDLLGLKKHVEENLEPSPSLSHPPGVHKMYFFNSVGGSGNNKGGSVLGVLDEIIRVGRAMGYSMEGCEKDIESIINSKGDEAVLR
ncbi:hypothetical protein Tco_0538682 [Tanacetum coccineum]